MRKKTEEKLQAIALRRLGYSVNEIVGQLGVAKSSISVWVRNIHLTSSAQKRLLTKIKLGQLKGAENKRRKTQTVIDAHSSTALHELYHSSAFSKTHEKMICALLYWCEGAKDSYQGVSFVNSDPSLIKLFLALFRNAFPLDEEKFRACIHLHHYHNPEKQLKFWTHITNIPKKQFIKPYLKPHTGKRIRENYPGCISIRYHSNDVARQLLATAKVFLKNYRISNN